MWKKIQPYFIGIIIGISIALLVFISTGRDDSQADFESLRNERNELIRSTEIIKSENNRIKEESAELRNNNIKTEKYNKQLESENKNYRDILSKLTAGNEKTESILIEYGNINKDLAEFIKQAASTD